MTQNELLTRFNTLARESVPFPACGNSALRHRKLFEVAEESVSLAKLVEAHWDAAAILYEAERTPVAGALYAVWASEVPGQEIVWQDGMLSGTKRFCSGLGIVDRALITVGGPAGVMLDIAVSPNATISTDCSGWVTSAFQWTCTGAITFRETPVESASQVGHENFYLERPGFWHGALGPAACWAGGAAGLLEYAQASKRRDSHTLAHVGAIEAEVAGMRSLLQITGAEMDSDPSGNAAAHCRALVGRHLIERSCSRILDHFARAFGPHPLALDADLSQRIAEVQLFIRQSHAERDLEQLGSMVLR